MSRAHIHRLHELIEQSQEFRNTEAQYRVAAGAEEIVDALDRLTEVMALGFIHMSGEIATELARMPA